MQRWHVTVGLVGLALTAAVFAPRLFGGAFSTPPVPPVVSVPPVPPLVVIPEVAPVATVSTSDHGHLKLDAGLDRSAVIAGATSERFIVINVTAPDDMGTSVRRPVDIAVAMDVSGSMTGEGKIDYARRSAGYLVDHMEPGDSYALVAFSDEANVKIPAGPVRDAQSLRAQIDRIYEGGGTNIGDGLNTSAAEALRASNGENAPRVVLLSDGNPTVGVQDADALARIVGDIHAKGVTVSVVGLGLDYNEDLLQRLADAGGGSYDFVDDPTELQTVFSEELRKSQSVVAHRTTVSVGWDGASGIELLDVVGWDERGWVADCPNTLCEVGFSVDMGDMYAGQTRKIVARVRVSAPREGGELKLASVNLGYDDVIDGAPGNAARIVVATGTQDVAVVDKSLDRDRTKGAAMAWGNEQSQLAARAYADGNIAEAEEYAKKGESWFGYNATLLGGDADLQMRAERTEQMRNTMPTVSPSAPAARRVVMQAKEDYLNDAR